LTYNINERVGKNRRRVCMEILNSVRRKVRDATLSALKASSDLIEISKINMAINSNEQNIKSLMLDMGRAVYESYRQGETLDAGLAAICEEIAEAEMDIEDMKLKILELRKMKKCSGCSAEIDEECVYCPKCGKKLENEKVDEDDDGQAGDESETASENEDDVEHEDDGEEDAAES